MVFSCKLPKSKMVERIVWSRKASNDQVHISNYYSFTFLAAFTDRTWANIGAKIQ